MVRKILLWCGIASSLLYVTMNVIAAMRYPGYDSISQTVSELSAVGAPTRPLWVGLAALYTALLIAFGIGVWQSAGSKRGLRVAGALLIAYAVFGLAWPPMHQRTVLAAGGGTLTDALHIAWTAVTVLLMVAFIGFAAAVFGNRFRLYSIGTVAAMLVFGYLTSLQAGKLQTNQPTPWMGVEERVNIFVYMLWIVVLGVALLRDRRTTVPRQLRETVSPQEAADLRRETVT
jgi:hypothetical protein